MFVKKIKAAELKAQLQSHDIKLMNVIDVRTKEEIANGSIAGSKAIAMDKLLQNPNSYLKKSETYYILCQSGVRSGKVCKKLKKEYNVISVAGGYITYSRT